MPRDSSPIQKSHTLNNESLKHSDLYKDLVLEVLCSVIIFRDPNRGYRRVPAS